MNAKAALRELQESCKSLRSQHGRLVKSITDYRAAAHTRASYRWSIALQEERRRKQPQRRADRRGADRVPRRAPLSLPHSNPLLAMLDDDSNEEDGDDSEDQYDDDQLDEAEEDNELEEDDEDDQPAASGAPFEDTPDERYRYVCVEGGVWWCGMAGSGGGERGARVLDWEGGSRAPVCLTRCVGCRFASTSEGNTFPNRNSDELRRQFLDDFNERYCAGRHYACGACQCLTAVNDLRATKLDWQPLKRLKVPENRSNDIRDRHYVPDFVVQHYEHARDGNRLPAGLVTTFLGLLDNDKVDSHHVDAADVARATHIRLCHGCFHSLRKNKLPANAIANFNMIGKIPAVLLALTSDEARVRRRGGGQERWVVGRGGLGTGECVAGAGWADSLWRGHWRRRLRYRVCLLS